MDKQNLLLLPGLLDDAALWEHQCKYLAELAEITVADLTPYDSMAKMAQSVLENAPACFALAGLSMGGYVAHEIMRRALDRVTKLALIDTSAQPENEEQTQHRKELIQLTLIGKFKEVTPRLLSLLVHPNRVQDQKLTNTIIAMAERVGQDAFLRHNKAIMARRDSREDLRRIKCPTLILVGRQDTLTPIKVHEEMAAGIAHARLIIIEDCGHLSCLEQPQAVTALLRDWLLYR